MDEEEDAVLAVGKWLEAEGITDWLIDGPEPGEPIKLQLYSEHAAHQERIQRHFGPAVEVSVLPPDAPRWAPASQDD